MTGDAEHRGIDETRKNLGRVLDALRAVICISSAFMTSVCPPSCFIATSKLMRVRVERLSKIMASESPVKSCGGDIFLFFNSCAFLSIPFSVSPGMSFRSMKCLGALIKNRL
jgi:hypothetical protein